jgi:hypothetical protein
VKPKQERLKQKAWLNEEQKRIAPPNNGPKRKPKNPPLIDEEEMEAIKLARTSPLMPLSERLDFQNADPIKRREMIHARHRERLRNLRYIFAPDSPEEDET